MIKRAIRYAQRKAEGAFKPNPDDLLFRGECRLFRTAMADCSAYGEYGCGASTIWAAKNTQAEIIAVDSSREWINKVKSSVGKDNQPQMVHVDIGELGAWGRPKAYAQRMRFADYIGAPWRFDTKPDVVLVDGRFRVACFLKSLIEASPGSTILFDDYTERSHYHVVEEFADRVDTCGTQVKFVVPENLDKSAIKAEIERFTYVMD